MKCVSRFVLFAVVIAMAGAAHADDWGTVSIISNTLGNNANRVCVGAPDATRPGDLGCSSNAPYVNPATGYLGIGTAQPSSTLHVYGGRGTFHNGIRLGAGYSAIDAGNASAGLFLGGSEGALNVIINPSGRVGIATTTPNTTLHVSGTIRIANGGETCDANRAGGIRYTGGNFEFCSGSVWQTLAQAAGSTPDRIVSGTSNVIVNSNGAISFTTAGSEQMVVDASGNVGIGTTAPSEKFHVESAGTLTTLLRSDTDGGAKNDNYIKFDNRESYWSIGSKGEVAEPTFRIAASGAIGTSDVFTLTTTGNVGIGTTSPAQKLSVVGNVEQSGRTDWKGGGISAANYGRVIHDNQNLTITTNGGSGHLLLSPVGNVGIATMSPQAPLDVSGSIKVAQTGTETCASGSDIGRIRVTADGIIQICRQ